MREQPFQRLEEARAEALAWRKRARERRKKGCETRFSLRRERERAEREKRAVDGAATAERVRRLNSGREFAKFGGKKLS